MKRTQLYLEDDQKNTLETIARQKKISMGAVVREAINKYIAANQDSFAIENIKKTQGLWKERTDIEESDKWVHNLRDDWNGRLYSSEVEK